MNTYIIREIAHRLTLEDVHKLRATCRFWRDSIGDARDYITAVHCTVDRFCSKDENVRTIPNLRFVELIFLESLTRASDLVFPGNIEHIFLKHYSGECLLRQFSQSHQPQKGTVKFPRNLRSLVVVGGGDILDHLFAKIDMNEAELETFHSIDKCNPIVLSHVLHHTRRLKRLRIPFPPDNRVLLDALVAEAHADLRQLVYLEAGLVGPNVIATLENVECLTVAFVGALDYSVIRSLTKLQTLTVIVCSAQINLAPVFQCPALQHLTIFISSPFFNGQITVDGFGANLKKVDIAGYGTGSCYQTLKAAISGSRRHDIILGKGSAHTLDPNLHLRLPTQPGSVFMDGCEVLRRSAY